MSDVNALKAQWYDLVQQIAALQKQIQALQQQAQNLEAQIEKAQ